MQNLILTKLQHGASSWSCCSCPALESLSCLLGQRLRAHSLWLVLLEWVKGCIWLLQPWYCFLGGLRRRVVFLLALNFVSSSKQPLSLCFAHFCLFLSRSSEVIVLLSNQGQGEMPLTLAVGLETLKQKPEGSWRTRPELSYFSQILFSPCQCSRLGLNTAPELKPHCLRTVCLVRMNYSHFALSVLCPALLQMLSRMAGNLEEKFRFFFFLVFFLSSIFTVVSLWKLLTCGFFSNIQPKAQWSSGNIDLDLNRYQLQPCYVIAEVVCSAVQLSPNIRGISSSFIPMWQWILLWH